MTNALYIAQYGLGKIAAPAISSIDPPRSSLEKHVATGYPQWRDSELEMRRWHFSLEYAVLTQEGPLADVPADGRPYRFKVPNDNIRIIRERDSTWEQRGSYLYSASPTLTVRYHRRALEIEFPPSFIEVLACRVAKECAEYETQSQTKDQTAEARYDKAIAMAGKLNAFIIGPEPTETLDEFDTWVVAREGWT